LIEILKGKTVNRLFYAAIWLAAFILLSFVLIKFAANVLEISEIGYEDVYFKNLSTILVTGLISFGILFVVFAANLLILRKNLVRIWGTPSIMKSVTSSFVFSAVFSLIISIFVTL